ncbi:DUF3310 domain-containing protein [Botrimarina mediterranea]|uniref:DUF3310 domain-containing protein n=1 Tax=Botrimarina mediterranea TaxID=2528022 RepID=UPI00118BDA20|nr:hypothetical protein K2D_16620 [Planctomycetes bacterium K2D]
MSESIPIRPEIQAKVDRILTERGFQGYAETCPQCWGYGFVWGWGRFPNCPKCNGKGHVPITDRPKVATAESDAVNHPPHYTSHPSGVECIAVTEHMSFCVGNAIKYLWRADLKENPIEDLRKAAWYVDREIKRRTESKEGV